MSDIEERRQQRVRVDACPVHDTDGPADDASGFPTCSKCGAILTESAAEVDAAGRAFANPCLYCGTDEDDVPYEDTEEHRDTSQHQWTVYNS